MCLTALIPTPDKPKYQRFKVTGVASAGGVLTFFIDKTKDLEVLVTYVTLPAYTSNITRNVSIERPDGTILGEERNDYLTSETSHVIFGQGFIVPHFDPTLQIDTRTVSANGLITVDIIYREVELS